MHKRGGLGQNGKTDLVCSSSSHIFISSPPLNSRHFREEGQPITDIFGGNRQTFCEGGS